MLFCRCSFSLSMADVFVTAVFVAFLTANAAPASMAGQVEPGQMLTPAHGHACAAVLA